MKPTNFTRTNVAPSSVMMSSPERSSYDLSHRNNLTLPLGKFIPVNIEKVIPGSTSRIGVTPSLSLETIQTPEIGRLRLDQHTFSVSARRINRDWRLFYEGNPTYSQLPMFNVGELMHSIFSFAGSWYADDQVHPRLLEHFLANSFSANPDITPATIAYAMLTRVAGYYYSKANPTGPGNNPGTSFGYLLDFYNQEYVRLSELANTYRAMSGSMTWVEYLTASLNRVHESGYWGEELFEPAIAVYEILKPYFGEGSLFDMLGYPCLKRYSRLFYTFANVLRNSMFDDLTGRLLPTATDTSHRVYSALVSFYNAPYSFYSNLTDANGEAASILTAVAFGDNDEHSPIKSEMELRAVYAAWYDQLRNWHIEKRDNVLDPDTFGSDSLLQAMSSVDNIPAIFNNIMLLLPRYCTWSKDFYTTIQTEDKFRYVFAPIDADPMETRGIVDESEDIDNFASPVGLDNLIGIVSEEFSSIFPSGRLFRSGDGSATIQALRNDLQTMRRAGMVEKYLARTYYHPDTYVGQIQARFGIEPSDIDIISSRYLFGQESLVEGEQVKNATGTEDTPAGLRTLVAGVGNNEGTLYQNGAEFTYVISFCSLVPLVTLDPLNMHASERYLLDLPTPEFANDTRIVISPSEFMRDCHMENLPIGYVPRYYHYRLRADEAHGEYLTDKRAQIWLNDSYKHYEDVFMPFGYTTSGLEPARSVYLWNQKLCYALDAYDMHIHIAPDAFLNLHEWDCIAYGNVDIIFETNTILPGAVDMF